jgi:hypothetical protein
VCMERHGDTCVCGVCCALIDQQGRSLICLPCVCMERRNDKSGVGVGVCEPDSYGRGDALFHRNSSFYVEGARLCMLTAHRT